MVNDPIKIKIPVEFEIDKEQINGIIFPKEAVENALSSLQYPLPVVYSNPCGKDFQEKVIGYVDGKDPENHFDEGKKLVSTSFDGKLFRGEADFVINKMDGNVIKDFQIIGVSVVHPETSRLRQEKRKE